MRKSNQSATTPQGALFGLLIFMTLGLCIAAVPITNFAPQGPMQSDLNVGGKTITNAATVQSTNVYANTVRATNSVVTPSLVLNGNTFTNFPSATDMLDGITTNQGAIIYRNGTNWTYLAAGTNGYVLTSQGTNAAPHYASIGDIALPQDLATNAAPIFGGLTVNGDINFAPNGNGMINLTLGTTGIGTFSGYLQGGNGEASNPHGPSQAELALVGGDTFSNVISLCNPSGDGFSAMAFRDQDNYEHGAIGIGQNTGQLFSSASGLGNGWVYIESSALNGTDPSYGFEIVQTGNNLGTGLKSFRRAAWPSNGDLYFYKNVPSSNTYYNLERWNVYGNDSGFTFSPPVTTHGSLAVNKGMPITGCATTGTSTITLPNTYGIASGDTVFGTDIAANTLVSTTTGTTVVLSQAATGSHTNLTMTFQKPIGLTVWGPNNNAANYWNMALRSPNESGWENAIIFGTPTTNKIQLDTSEGVFRLIDLPNGVAFDSTAVTGSSSTNTFTGMRIATNVRVTSATASTLAGFDGNKNLKSLTVGSGLSFDGTTLASTTPATIYVAGVGLTQSGTGTVTFSADTSLVATLTGTQTLTNKSFLSTTSPQVKFGYDASNYLTYSFTSTGSVTLAATGTNPSIILTPGGTGGVFANGVRVDPVVQTWDGSADVTVNAATTLLRLTIQTTANRTVTLPAANAYPAGTALIIDISVGIGNTKTLTVQRAGTDNIVGLDGTNATSISLGQTKGLFTFIRDGTSKWAPDNTPHTDIFGTITALAYQFGNAIIQGSGKVIGLPSDYLIKWSNSTSAFFSGTPDLGLSRNATGVLEVNNGTAGNYRDAILRALTCGTAGSGIAVKEGSNAKQGTATLVAGTVTVSNTAVTANSRIFVTGGALNSSSALGELSVPTQTAATSFVITSYVPGGVTTQTGDLRTVNYEIFEPAP